MPFPQVPTPSTEMDTEQTKQYLVGLVRYLNWLLANMDTLNINRLDAKVIISESITTDKLAANSVTADKIRAGSVTADKMQVNELSAISANLGHITAGLIEAITMISSVITGSLIQTVAAGNYPRIELSATNNLLKAENNASNYVTLYSSFSGSPALHFLSSGAGFMTLTQLLNTFNMSGTGDIRVTTSSGKIYLDAPGGINVNGVNLNSKFAANMTFDPGTRNLKLYAPDGTQLAIVNIP